LFLFIFFEFLFFIFPIFLFFAIFIVVVVFVTLILSEHWVLQQAEIAAYACLEIALLLREYLLLGGCKLSKVLFVLWELFEVLDSPLLEVLLPYHMRLVERHDQCLEDDLLLFC
jgi:hypothetical protein